ncbi:MAG: ABC transporter permease [Anaerolineales bacterium]|nr:ABC transporter permease [Anaerolineae bacterium]PWB54794.1 MAG: ABC transporter permease [Anaerolineales bacterium]
MKAIKNTFKELLRYPSAIVGLVIIGLLLLLSVYAVISIPYKQAIILWRGGEGIWYKSPRYAPPAWLNYFRRDKLPETIVLSSMDGTAPKTVTPGDPNGSVVITYTIDYPYSGFPQDIAIFFTAKYDQKEPFVNMSWLTPDGREIRVANFAISKLEAYYISQDTKLQRRLAGLPPQQGLFVADPKAGLTPPVNGTYQLIVDASTFEPNSDVDAEMVLYGQLYGIAGTDHLRRDLRVALLWGTPVALAFGLLAALGTTAITMVIAAIGVWFGGWADGLIQRITEVNMVLPFLPILIMVGTFYSHSIWVILGVVILLSIFGASIKTYRAVFLQVKESSYIEAARAYGAGSSRIIFSYLVPRIVPLLIPQLVTLIPSFVFLEAGLAILGLGDPTLPTWGKIINDAQQNGALYKGLYYWVLEPAVFLMITGLAFALLGFSLDRIFNPRLRGM